jgi:hypothetical protein
MAPEVMEQVSFSSLRFVQSDYGWTVGLVDQGSRPGIPHVFIVPLWRMFCSSSFIVTGWWDGSYHLLKGEFLYIMFVRKGKRLCGVLNGFRLWMDMTLGGRYWNTVKWIHSVRAW